MNRAEMLLTQLQEECAEVIQEVSKSKRFGLHEVYTGPGATGLSNIQRVYREVIDVLAIIEMLQEDQVLVGPTMSEASDLMNAKKEKVERLLLYSKECGRLTS